MGSIGGLLGTAGGASGTGYKAPGTSTIQGGQITGGTTQGQIGTSYTGTQGALGSQTALLAALQGQNGLGAQSGALGSQQALNAQLAGAGGVQNQSQALASQQALAGQQQATAQRYAQIASGQGPNPAMAQLNQTTGQNVAAQSALMAGQRGASSNVGLLARQAAQQGAATQQQAVGQGATMAAQQELGALSGLSSQQQAIGSTQQNVANISAQQIGQQQQQQQALAGQSNVLANQQIGATTANTQAQQAEQAQLQQALAQYNTQQVGLQSNINQGNVGLANTNMQGQQGVIGGVLNGAGGVLKTLAKGGLVEEGQAQKLADGGDTSSSATPASSTLATNGQNIANTNTGPQSSFGKFLKGWNNGIQGSNSNDNSGGPFNLAGNNPGAKALQQGVGNLGAGLVSAFTSPGTTPASTGMGANSGAASAVYPNQSTSVAAAKGGLAKKGGHVKAQKPSQKAEKKGNSYDNDKIPAYLSEGEVVIPRSIMQSKDPVRSSADFVAKLLSKRRKSA